jgi:hypothetical protein
MSEADLTCKTFQRQLMHFWDDRMPKTQKEGNKAGINVPEQQVPKERSKLQDCSLLQKHKQKHPTKVKQSHLSKLHKETLKLTIVTSSGQTKTSVPRVGAMITM